MLRHLNNRTIDFRRPRSYVVGMDFVAVFLIIAAPAGFITATGIPAVRAAKTEGRWPVMAKLSARGAIKIAQATREDRDSEGWDHKRRYALRSDGKVLRAHDTRSPSSRENYGARGWNRGGYSIVGHADLVDFVADMETNGYTVKLEKVAEHQRGQTHPNAQPRRRYPF